MTEFTPNPDNPESQPEFNPEPIQDAHDAISEQMPERMELERGMDWLLERQKELYAEHRQKRDRGESLSPLSEQELDDIYHALLELNHVIQKYKSDD